MHMRYIHAHALHLHMHTYLHSVMEEMVSSMFNEQCLEELFRPQKLFSRDGLKVLFHKVAHSSIMRLNSVAMDKVKTLSLPPSLLV